VSGTTSRNWLSGAITALVLVFLMAPLAVVVLFSFHETAALSLPFTGFSLRWYREVLGSQEFRDAAINSLYVATIVALSTLVIGTAAAYGLTRAPARLRGPLGLLFFLPITLPGLFIGVALLVFFVRAKFELSLETVAIGHLIYVFPYFFLIARAAIDRLDAGLEEAARDLGASPWVVFRKVTLPQIWPVLAAATTMAFALSLDEFVITFFVIGPDSTLPLFIWSGLRQTIDPSINTVSTLLLVTSLLIWLFGFALTALFERRRRGRASVPVPIA
jgi:ABC-type spermidine/putrescine transport system permease subunit II